MEEEEGGEGEKEEEEKVKSGERKKIWEKGKSVQEEVEGRKK